MTNKEFYGDKLLAIALEDNCHELHIAVYDESCLGRKECEDCEFSSVESIEKWLNAEHEEPLLLENGDGLKPGDWIMVQDEFDDSWKKRAFVAYYDGHFIAVRGGYKIGEHNEVEYARQARMPMDGE